MTERRLLLPFDQFPEEARVIGRLVVSYGELEYLLALLVGAAIHDDECAVRVVFRLKGEEARIQVADALVRRIYENAGLADVYNEALGALRHCKTIRNQYAHSHWIGDEGILRFAALDEEAKKSEPPFEITFNPLGNVVLNQQARWFDYTHQLLAYLFRLSLTRRGNHPPLRQKLRNECLDRL